MDEELNVQTEDSNIFDEFAVAVFKDGIVVGHGHAMFHRSWWEHAGTFSRNGIAVWFAKSLDTEDCLKLKAKAWLFPVSTSSLAKQNT